MTPAEAIAEARSLLDELGVSSGFWVDSTDLYPYLSSAEREAAQIICSKFNAMRAAGILDESPSIEALIKLDVLHTTTVGSGYQEYALPSDFMYTYSADYDSAGGTAKKQCTLVSFEEARSRENNTLIKAVAAEPLYYIRTKKIGFFPQPSGAGATAYDHYYLCYPAAVASPGSTPFTLGPETHKAFVNYVVACGLAKDGRMSEASNYFKLYYQTIGSL